MRGLRQTTPGALNEQTGIVPSRFFEQLEQRVGVHRLQNRPAARVKQFDRKLDRLAIALEGPHPIIGTEERITRCDLHQSLIDSLPGYGATAPAISGRHRLKTAGLLALAALAALPLNPGR